MRLLLIFLFISASFSARGEETSIGCLSANDLTEVSRKFNQFDAFLKTTRNEYCKKDLGDKWFFVARALVNMKNLKFSPRTHQTIDDLSIKVLPDDDWWAYFTKRANRFDLNPKYCDSSTEAYVWNHIPGEINLCPIFFNSNNSGLAISLLMHEVKHFDNVHHEPCRANQFKGMYCDSSIKVKGAYAVSVQTSVDLAFYSNIPEDEKKQLLYSLVQILDFFNSELTLLKSTKFYLVNSLGEVWMWDLNSPEQAIQLIAKLKGPAEVLVSPASFTIFPLDKKIDAYRLTLNWLPSSSIGEFAEAYNKINIAERLTYLGPSYETGSELKNGTLQKRCQADFSEIAYFSTNKIPEPMEGFIYIDERLTYNNFMRGSEDSFILAKSGKVYQIICSNPAQKSLYFKLTDMTLPKEIKKFFVLKGRYWGLSDKGEFFELKKQGSSYVIQSQVKFGIANEQWVSVSRLNNLKLFDELWN